MFEAYSGETRYGYIAIDDILLDDSLNCPVKGVFMSAFWRFGKLMRIRNIFRNHMAENDITF